MIFPVKHDGYHKARFLASGHKTHLAFESLYSGVVSTSSICLIQLIPELNDQEIHQTDVRNVYLEVYTKEKIFILAG